ncbi:DUF4199 domain-containing protein [Pseudidiomarina sediminum]|uniref:DUF4199 domain-containing protein n=1 Tax=Pseudidiomarina sediminum TaxID=431675 RepID=UPI001C95F6A5|nr:DUF4199 domain-containing protein [Pseudidiomarina sediminum]MBY6062750.1 DUF4199 domain-containing protein [Pseudidiomarina sediminum]
MKELKWGVIFAIALTLWIVFERVVGLHGPLIAYHRYVTNIFAILAVLIYVLALRDVRRAQPGHYLRWSHGFLSGIKITLVVAALSPGIQWFSHYVISPHFFSNMIAFAVNEGLMTQAQAEAYFSLNSYMVQSVTGALIMGALTSAIVALFLRRQPQRSSSATHSDSR